MKTNEVRNARRMTNRDPLLIRLLPHLLPSHQRTNHHLTDRPSRLPHLLRRCPGPTLRRQPLLVLHHRAPTRLNRPIGTQSTELRAETRYWPDLHGTRYPSVTKTSLLLAESHPQLNHPTLPNRHRTPQPQPHPNRPVPQAHPTWTLRADPRQIP